MLIVESGYSPTPSLLYPRVGWSTLTDGLESSSVTASSTDTGFDAGAPLDDDTAESWQPATDTDLDDTWAVDLGSAGDASYAGLVGSFDGCRVALQTSPDNSVWATVAETDDPLPDETRVVVFLFETRRARYWRLHFTEAVPTMSVFRVGPELAVEQKIYGGHAPVTLSRETALRTALTRGGQFLGQAIRREGVVGGVDLQHLGGDWYRENFDPFVRQARTRPFFWVWRPVDPNVGTAREVAYLWAEEDIRPQNMGKKDLVGVTFGVRGLSNDEVGVDGWLYLAAADGAWSPDEAVAGGDFDDADDWDASGATLSTSGGRLKITNTSAAVGTATQTGVAVEQDQPHVLLADLFDGSVGAWRIRILTDSDGTEEHVSHYDAEGRAPVVFIPASSAVRIELGCDTSVAGDSARFGRVTAARCLLIDDPLVAVGAKQLSLKGGPASTPGAIYSGEKVTLRLWNGWQTVTLTEDFTTDANGEGTLSFTPGLLDGVYGGGPVVVHKPFRRVTGASASGVARLPEAVPFDTDVVWHWDANSRGLAPSYGSGTPTLTADADNWYFDSDGLLKQVSGADSAVFEFDPITKALKGQRIQGARANLALHSEDLTNAAWVKIDSTITANQAVAPDGETTMDLVTQTSASARVTQGYIATADAHQVVSKFFKRGNNDWVLWRFYESANGNNIINAWFNLATGVKGTVSAGGTATVPQSFMVDVGGGIYRCIVMGKINNGATALTAGSESVDADNSGARVNGATRYEWGAQIENNAPFWSSYIKTTTAAVTRSADSDDLLVNLIPGFVQTENTCVAEFILTETVSGPGVFSLQDGGSGERISVFFSGSDAIHEVRDGGADQAAGNMGAATVGIAQRVAIGSKVNNFGGSLNGGATATDTSGTMPTVTTLTKGALLPSAGQEPLNGYLRRLSIFKTKKPARMIRSLSA